MKILITSLLAVLVLAGAAAGPTPSGDAILGVWKTYNAQGKVDCQLEIYKEHDKYCAKIVSLTEPNWPAGDDQGMAGKPKNDRHNPNPELRNRPVVGLRFMHDFVYNAAKKTWTDGRIYDPECGKTYRCKMSLTPENKLEVRGYIGISLLGRTETWTR